MYSPALQTIFQGLRAKELECGYIVQNITVAPFQRNFPNIPLGFDRVSNTDKATGYTIPNPFDSRAMQSGDVLIVVGDAQCRFYLKQCKELKRRGVLCVFYYTEPQPLDFNLFKEGWQEIWYYSSTGMPKGDTTAGPAGHLSHRYVPPGATTPTYPVLDRVQLRSLPTQFLFLGQMVAHAEFRLQCWNKLKENPFTAPRLVQRYNVITDADWGALAQEVPHTVFLNIHRLNLANASLESFRITTLLSIGAVIVTQPSNPADLAAFQDMIIVEKSMCSTEWSQETKDLLDSPSLLTAWRDRSQKLYKKMFTPSRLLNVAGVWG